MVFAIRMEKTFIHRTPFRLGKDGVMVWAMSYRLQDKWWDKDGALKRAYVRKTGGYQTYYGCEWSFLIEDFCCITR